MTVTGQPRVHAIQTGTVAVKARQRHGRGPGPTRSLVTLMDRRWTEQLPILAWLIEHPEGLMLVDTGESSCAGDPGYFPKWHPYFRFGVRASVAPEEELGPQLERHGIGPGDIRRVIMTHLHTDHAGGLAHVVGAEILVSRAEWRVATSRAGRAKGYLREHWPRGLDPTLVDLDASHGSGLLGTGRPVTAAGDVLMLPTPGHTPGHLSVAVRTNRGIVLIAGDASYTQTQMLEGVADGVTNAPASARRTLAAIRALAGEEPLVYLPSHDPGSERRLEEMEAVPAGGPEEGPPRRGAAS
jgi:N-acyl homoserine lactone hydrolase